MEYRAYWAMKQLNMDLNAAGEKRRRVFEVGQQVLLYNSRLKLFPGKLRSRWSGPYTVTKVLPYGAIQVSNENKGTFTVNGQRLKHYWGGDFSKQKSTVQLETPE
ncbi:uncharacterized protein LOC111374907 [Olea europaea var. sylvestris]|uniref:uncharacterized protein LOC111374907 n=1 Tax=Olea europaea var. sylvestris TaxID=158386 RepID=UPI000C1D6FBE|nr:uncharacterized protein LOC111374907 [Olea europaea var. sylvestris]